MSRCDEPTPHRLFAAIVLMGSGLAAGCGGVAEGGRQVSPGGGSNISGGGAGTPPASGAGSGGVAGGSIGVVGGATSTSGSASGGSPLNIGFGGAEPDPLPEPVDPGPFACPPEQWSCPSTLCDDPSTGYVLPDACACDPTRPLVPSDCPPGQVFVCQTATRTTDDRRLTKPVALACLCLPKSDCATECVVAYDRRRLSCSSSPDELSTSCGCAVVLLK
ncbi:MAG TPA: hypothetical protein VNG33_17650 [Polyangiaceae bacterium]|nr:hypothetical protein [Polyangiaceae bacterium]